MKEKQMLMATHEESFCDKKELAKQVMCNVYSKLNSYLDRDNKVHKIIIMRLRVRVMV